MDENIGMNYFRNGEIIEITIRDHTRAKIDQFKASIQDKKAVWKIMQLLKDKYDLEPEIPGPEKDFLEF